MAALPGWVAARLIVLGALWLSHVLASLLDVRALRLDRLHQGLLGWDADWYYRIAHHGYASVPSAGLRFFPLVPLLARALSIVFLGHVGGALLLLANGPALALGALLHRLVLNETGDASMARRSAWLIALAPPSFVLVMGYTEAIAWCLAVLAFMALRRSEWRWASVALFLAGLTRPVGVVLAVPAAVEALRGWRTMPFRQLVARGSTAAAPVAGTGVYLAWVWIHYGDPLHPLTVQSNPGLRGKLAFPLVTLWDALYRAMHGELVRNLTHIPWIVLLTFLVVVLFKRWPLSYAAFAAVTVLLAASAEFWGSFERYAFGGFPVLMAMAGLITTARAERTIIRLSALCMCIYAVLAFLNAYTP